jgi:hypothetical protein
MFLNPQHIDQLLVAGVVAKRSPQRAGSIDQGHPALMKSHLSRIPEFRLEFRQEFPEPVESVRFGRAISTTFFRKTIHVIIPLDNPIVHLTTR